LLKFGRFAAHVFFKSIKELDMTNSWKFSLSALMCAWAFNAQADASPPHLPQLPLSAQQQAALGIQVTKIQTAGTAQILASAWVGTQPGKDLTVSAPYAGQISRLLVGVGDRVKAGSSLAYFTSPQLGDARRQLQEAKLELQTASSALQRDEAMFQEGIIPEVRLQITRNKLQAAQATLAARESEFKAGSLSLGPSDQGYATASLQAPISGVITQALGDVGQRVEAGTVLFKMADDSALQLDIQLSPEKASLVQVGDLVSIADRQAQAKARAVVLQRGRLQVGEWVSATLQPQLKHQDNSQNHWLVPARSVVHFGKESLVFVKDSQGFMPTPVKIISSNDDTSLIQAPLRADTVLAQSGLASLRAMLQKDE
jgi:membrane fusion protein, heavy metal efflux system